MANRIMVTIQSALAAVSAHTITTLSTRHRRVCHLAPGGKDDAGCTESKIVVLKYCAGDLFEPNCETNIHTPTHAVMRAIAQPD